MSSEDGLDYLKLHPTPQQKYHLHHSHGQQNSLVSSSGATVSTANSTPVPATPTQVQQTPAAASFSLHQPSTAPGVLAINTVERRRKSSLSYQYQVQQIADGDICGATGSPCPSLDSSLIINNGQNIANGGCPVLKSAVNYANVASPNRYSQQFQHQQQDSCHLFSGRLSLHSIDRYDDSLATCCLPPPSPAPNSDRIVMGIPSPSISSTPFLHHYDQSPAQPRASTIKYSNNILQRTASPNSRYCVSDRYEAFPRCDRFVTATHFLANSTPLVSNDTYTYLSSAVHTPVKRYVPTPPLKEIYNDPSQPTTQCSNNSSGGQLPATQTVPSRHQRQQHSHVGMPSYRFRMKCCVIDHAGNSSDLQTLPLPEQRASITDHYVTAPRVKPMKCYLNGSSSNHQLTVATASSSPTGVHHSSQPRQIRSSCMAGEYIRRTPSVEFLGVESCAATPNSGISEPKSSTCLHCSSMRRTVGVHQTTQTTGPTSPVLQQSSTATLNVSSSSGDTLDAGASCSEQFIAPTLPTSSSLQPQPASALPQTQQTHADTPSYTSAHTQSLQPSSMLHSHSGLISRNAPQSVMLQQKQPQPLPNNHDNLSTHCVNNAVNNAINSTPQRSGTLTSRQQMQRFSRKQRLREYVRREIAKFYGVDIQTEDEEKIKWNERQKRLALRRFGLLKPEVEQGYIGSQLRGEHHYGPFNPSPQVGDRPDILPAQTTDENQIRYLYNGYDTSGYHRIAIEKKASVLNMLASGLSYIIQTLNKRQLRNQKQWSRSFAPTHVSTLNGDNPGDLCEGLTALQEDEMFFDISSNDIGCSNGNAGGNGSHSQINQNLQSRQIYVGERVQGWRTSGEHQHYHNHHQQPQSGTCMVAGNNAALGGVMSVSVGVLGQRSTYRGSRISAQLLDGILDNSRRPVANKVKLFCPQEPDDRSDYRPFFTYWMNTVQVLVLTLSLICYGIGPIGVGIEHKSGQVLVTSLSLQTVQHQEQRNVWIGLRGNDLVHLGGKFTACMRRDVKIIELIAKTRRQERETACCIRNDDSGCVQSSQADCSIRGLWPTKSISTWKKWSPGESGPGGRISGSVCGLDPKFCDAPASIAPYEWPDDITKWPICRKTNSFSQRFRFKDQTAEHMVCEVIGHPCCTGVYGECRITTREYCDFVNGYFHEEASLCSQAACLHNICGMFPFLSAEVPDQLYRLFASLCLHAGIIHLAITVAFQHVFLADLERLIGPIRTAIVYIGSGLAGNLTSAILVPYKLEVGPLSSVAGVLSSLLVLLLLIHWKHLKKPHLALLKLMVLIGTLFGIGTMPWQQNFAGLSAGLICGMLLTIAVVPFVSITKYARKSKINLVWTFMLFHLFTCTAMLILFYAFPIEFTSFNFGDVLSGSMEADTGSVGGSDGVFDTNILGGDNTIHQRHHPGEDIAMNGGVVQPGSLLDNNLIGLNGSSMLGSTYSNIRPQRNKFKQNTLEVEYYRNLNENSVRSSSIQAMVSCKTIGCTNQKQGEVSEPETSISQSIFKMGEATNNAELSVRDILRRKSVNTANSMNDL